jgi:hypothetical protein
MTELKGDARMPRLISKPTIIKAAGDPPKQIEEFIGCVNSGTPEISIARMRSPQGWSEPGQRPQFTEYTLVLKGMVKVESGNGIFEVNAGQAFIAFQDEWVRYSTPFPHGAEYIAICIPAFSPETVQRDSHF